MTRTPTSLGYPVGGTIIGIVIGIVIVLDLVGMRVGERGVVGLRGRHGGDRDGVGEVVVAALATAGAAPACEKGDEAHEVSDKGSDRRTDGLTRCGMSRGGEES